MISLENTRYDLVSFQIDESEEPVNTILLTLIGGSLY